MNVESNLQAPFHKTHNFEASFLKKKRKEVNYFFHISINYQQGIGKEEQGKGSHDEQLLGNGREISTGHICFTSLIPRRKALQKCDGNI